MDTLNIMQSREEIPPASFSTSKIAALSTSATTESFNSFTLEGAPPGPTFSPPIPSPRTAPTYLFVFGDSFTTTSFMISKTLPSPDNPLGNPSYPAGVVIKGMENWLEILTTRSNTTILTYNFSFGGMTVTNSVSKNQKPDWPSLENQVDQFIKNLALMPRPVHTPWTDINSIFIIWIGHNDVSSKVFDNLGSSLYKQELDAFHEALRRLAGVGAKRFLVLGCPPISREPIYRHWPNSISQLASDAKYWDESLRQRMDMLLQLDADLSLEFLDISKTMNYVLDHPTEYGAPNELCWNKNVSSGVVSWKCLFADEIHPGIPMNKAIAEAVSSKLREVKFLAPLPALRELHSCMSAICLSWIEIWTLLAVFLTIIALSSGAWLLYRYQRARSRYDSMSTGPRIHEEGLGLMEGEPTLEDEKSELRKADLEQEDDYSRLHDG